MRDAGCCLAGARHPTLLEKLVKLEKLLGHPDLDHPNQSDRIAKVRAMRQKIQGLDMSSARKQTAAFEFELKNAPSTEAGSARGGGTSGSTQDAIAQQYGGRRQRPETAAEEEDAAEEDAEE